MTRRPGRPRPHQRTQRPENPGSERGPRTPGASNSPRPPRRRALRGLTRRGRLLLTGAVLLGLAAAVTIPLVLSGDEDQGPGRPQSLTVPEGWRARQVFTALDGALHLPKGATEKSVPRAGLALPGDAGGNPEGYLYPATYPLAEDSTPAEVLSFMVNTANQKYEGKQLAAGAERNAVSRYETVKVASIVQAEAATPADMGRVARVVYNRLDRGMPLQMDSTVNYAMNRSTLHTTTADTRLKSPYNTYTRHGLPPTPIANPGEQALRAAVSPRQGDWLYFVTVAPGDTRFTADYEAHKKNVAEFNRRHASRSPTP